MNISHISHRVVLLSVAIVLAVMILAAVVGYFAITHAQATPGTGQPVPAGYNTSLVIPKLKIESHPAAVKAIADNCMAVPSWDITQIHLQSKGSSLLQLYFKLDSNDAS